MTTDTTTPSTPAPMPAAFPEDAASPPRRLLRSRDRVFAGVAAGIADYTGLPTVLVRLLFVASAFMGWGLLLYPVLWVVVPDADRR